MTESVTATESESEPVTATETESESITETVAETETESGKESVRATAVSRATRAFAAALVVAVLAGCGKGEPAAMPPACTLEIGEDDAGRLTLALLLVNPGTEVERGSYAEPFTHFELEVLVDGRPVDVDAGEPAAAGPAAAGTGDAARSAPPGERVDVVLRPGGGMRLVPAVRLRFDPRGAGGGGGAEGAEGAGAAAPAAAGDPPTWVIRHPPAPVHVRVDPVIDGMARRRCEADHPASSR